MNGTASRCDGVIKCRDCGEPFIVTAAERAFYTARGHHDQPRHCRTCRRHRREQLAAAVVTRCAPVAD